MKLSIIVPTRERGDTLFHTLRTLVGQDYESCEIIVGDNASTDGTRDVVDSFSDSRLKYVRSPSRVSMADNWEFARQQAAGEFITYIGDDDGFLPGAVAKGMRWLDESGLDALVWDKLEYCWPDNIDERHRNWFLLKDRSGTVEIANGRARLRKVMRFREAYTKLPCLYNAIVRRSVVNSVAQSSMNGRFFNAITPDVFSGIALATIVNRYLLSTIPFSVNGASRHSAGTSFMRAEVDAGSPALTFASENGLSYDRRIRSAPSTIVCVMGEYLLVRQFLPGLNLPEPNWDRYIGALLRSASREVGGPAISDSARFTAGQINSRIRISSFAQQSSRHGPGPLSTGCNSIAFTVPEDMVSNIYDACRLAAGLVPQAEDLRTTGRFEKFGKGVRDALLVEAKTLYRSL